MARGLISTDDYNPINKTTNTTSRSTRNGMTSSRSTSSLSNNNTNSPITTRSGRALGNTGSISKNGPNYSPYARRTTGGRSGIIREEREEDEQHHQQQQVAINSNGTRKELNQQVHGGLISMVRSLPGRAFGLFRSSSSKAINSSESFNDLAAEEEGIEATGAVKGRGLPINRSKGLHQLSNQLPSSASMPSLYNAPPPPPPLSRQYVPSPGPPRSAHSTLFIPTNTSQPVFNRATSPALSTTSGFESNNNSNRNRSPSPTRNGLAGSMSAFNFNDLQSNSTGPLSSGSGLQLPNSPSSSSIFNQPATSARNYGLTSRSPFATRSPSVARFGSPSIRSSSSTTAIGHPLFPYASNQTRGQSPSSATKRPYATTLMSDAGSPPPRSRNGGSINGSVSSYNFVPSLNGSVVGGNGRMGSPLNPYLGGGGEAVERAKKKQLVWDADKGLVSREELERERERTALPLPKNAAERILELLEGLGRTPMGEAKRAAATRPKQINVPTPTTAFSSRPVNAVSTPLSPYTRRPKPGVETSNTPVRAGTGLSGVFRAREERRRLAEDAERSEREERERERMEDEDRDRLRELRRQERIREAEFDREEREAEQDRIDADVPRRKTRSMLKALPVEPKKAKGKGKAAATPKGKGKAKSRKDDEEDDDMGASAEPEERRSKSPAPQASKALSPPSTQALIPFPPPLPQQSGASSLRPGRAHSSRAHTSSAKVFSAREEDLPPIDESELGKIKLPTMMFPANFSFGGPPVVATEPVKALVPVEKPATSLLDKMPITSAPKAITSNVFAPSTLPSTLPSTSSPFSFAPVPSLSTPVASIPAFTAPTSSIVTAKPTPVSASIPTSSSSDFFSKPSAPSPVVATTTKPNFFGAALASTSVSSPAATIPTPPNPFSFGATTPKPLESPPAAVPAAVPAVLPASNPFGGFGKLATPVVSAPSPFGSSSGSLFGTKPVEKKETPSFLMPTTSTSLFGQPSPSTTPAVQSPAFTFGAATPQVLSREASPFATNIAPAPLSTFAGFGASPAIEDPDEDSGMEDETGAAPASAIPARSLFAPSAAPASNLFGAPSSSSGTTSPFTFGATKPAASTNVFGSAAAAAPTSLFAPSTSTPFGGFGSTPASPAVTSASPFTFGAAPALPTSSAAPSPFGMPSPVIFGGASTSLSGSSTPVPSPFSFNAPPATATPNMFGSATPSASPFGGAGGFAFTPKASTPAAAPSPFAFGNTTSAAPVFGGFGGGATASPFGATAPSGTFTFGATASGAPLSAPGSPSGGATFNLGSGGEDNASPGKGGRRIAPLRRKR